MPRKMVVIFIIFVLSLLPDVKSKSENFGDYKLEFSNCTLCRGPKAKNLTELTVLLTKYDNGTYMIFHNITFFENIFLPEAKASIYKVEGGMKKNLLYSYKINPCQHFVFAEMTRQYLNSTDCHIKKGKYFLKTNLTTTIQTFFGALFYYGEYLLHFSSSTKKGNIGDYIAELNNFTLCRGPKARNISDISMALNRYENGTYMLFMNASFPNDVIIHEIKMSVHQLHGVKKSILWIYKVTEACKHFFFAQIISQHLNSSNCHVKKGFYSVEFNLNRLIRIFFGNSFYYGEYLLNPIIATKQGNILCLRYVLSVKKKKMKIIFRLKNQPHLILYKL
ncbi:hypothetical protein ABMA28_005731 [Loxostege sticticalis]|uniref:Uncharacterized protein n=1 Tax=Loxostege sticticalis TaxID=481309 RepID=A0ABD0SPX2_LOXSC